MNSKIKDFLFAEPKGKGSNAPSLNIKYRIFGGIVCAGIGMGLGFFFFQTSGSFLAGIILGIFGFREPSLGTVFLIALSLRATVVEAYVVPTGSMENTILTGDFLFGNKFVYGMRTPNWIGIPYTEIGFEVPWMRFPAYKVPQQRDVAIFNYPRDSFQKYVKRLVAVAGQTINISNKKLFVGGEEFILPENGKFVDRRILDENFVQQGIFLSNSGNRDYMKQIRIPKKGDEIFISDTTEWEYLIPLMLMDGHEVTLRHEIKNKDLTFTMNDPNDIYRRYLSGIGSRSDDFATTRKVKELRMKYYSHSNPNGWLVNIWSFKLPDQIVHLLYLDGVPFEELISYMVEQDYYWMMGDNRDDSADSRYWGFVPHSLLLGEAVITWMSWNFKSGLPRFNRIGNIIN
tara:strand:- start:4132 stop:5334 length:1203 start_codon:yes stop_codon:yes gene_type:complete